MSNASKQKRILNVKIIREIDNDSSYFDYLGKFSNEPGPVERTIDRKATMKRGEFRYFIAANSPAETGNPNSVQEDYHRVCKFCDGRLWFLSVGAQAEVILTDSCTLQTINGGWFCGIESDSDESYLASVEEEQLEELRGELSAIGFSDEEIDAAFAKRERIERP